MICMFCNENMADGEIRCPVCGFTHMNFTEEGGSEVIKNMLLSYKQRRLGDVSVEISVFKYVIDNGKISSESSQPLKIADARDLEIDKPVWLDKEFYGTETEREIKLELHLGGSEKKDHTVAMKLPPCQNMKIGCVLESGLRIRLLAGTPEAPVSSEQFQLV